MTVRRRKVVALAVGLVALVSFAPSQVGSQELQVADTAWLQQDFEKAAAGYTKVVRDDPDNARARYRLGFALHSLSRFDEAIPHFKKAIELKFAPLQSKYNLACAYAMSGRREEALQALDTAIKSGYTMTNSITTDVDLVSIRNSERFFALMRWADKPVQQFSEGRKLEGLQGVWEVTGPNNSAGTLTSNVGSKGYSRQLELIVDGSRWAFLFAYFSAPDNEWRASGADAEGGVYEGQVTVQDGSVVFTGSQMANGKKKEVRVRVALAAWQDGQFVKESQSESGWTPIRDYGLSRSQEGDGGR